MLFDQGCTFSICLWKHEGCSRSRAAARPRTKGGASTRAPSQARAQAGTKTNRDLQRGPELDLELELRLDEDLDLKLGLALEIDIDLELELEPDPELRLQLELDLRRARSWLPSTRAWCAKQVKRKCEQSMRGANCCKSRSWASGSGLVAILRRIGTSPDPSPQDRDL